MLLAEDTRSLCTTNRKVLSGADTLIDVLTGCGLVTEANICSLKYLSPHRKDAVR